MARRPNISSLDAWINSYFQGQTVVDPNLRKDLRFKLKYAGFANGVPTDKNSLALKIAHRVVHESTPVNAEARLAAVVSATSACPRCGGAMVTVKLANDQDSRYCSNTQCRVTCWIEP